MTKQKRFILLLTIAVCACLTFGLGIASVRANEITLTAVNYQETYDLGEEFTVQSAKFTYNGQDYDTEGIINYPSGKRIASKSVLLTECGSHFVEYVASIGGKTVTEKVYFTVLDKVYAIDGAGEFEYGKNEYFRDIGNVDGLNVALGKESTFKFNKIIDVSNLTRYDTVMQWYNTPKIVGSYDVRKVNFRLTDVYDSENYVEMQFKYSPDNGFSTTYIVANANGQLPSGLHYREKGPSATSYEYNGYHYTLYQNNRHYGYRADLSFNGQIVSWLKDFSENCMRFAIDYEQKALYCTPAYGNNRDKCVVIDLDDQRFFGDNLWGGFTTGEVLLSINAEEYSTSQYNFFITEIFGHNIGDLYSANTVSPSITVDTLDFDKEELPLAVVGREYKLFPATAFDDSEGEIACKSVVYYNYNNSSKSQINVIDGKFVPKRVGEYTIVYTAKDSFGNSCEEILTVNAVIKERLEYSLSEYNVNFEAGDVISVATPQLENADKIYTLEIYAKHKNTDTVYKIDESLNFRPFESGNYVIEYHYLDYSFSDVFSYEINVVAPNTIKFVREPVLPKYVIKNSQYVFDAGEAYLFGNSATSVSTEIYVSAQGLQKTKIDNYTYTVTADVASVDLIYVAGEREETYTIPVVDVGYGEIGKLNLSKYLQGEEFIAKADRYGITYTTDKSLCTDGKAKLCLINPAYLIMDFQIAFTGVTDDANFENVKVYFTSLKNALDVIEFTFEKQADLSTMVTVTRGNYSVTGASSSKFCSGEETGFSIIYANKEFTVGNSSIKIPYEILFDGFGDYFYIDFELNGVYGQSAIYVKKLVNQTLNNSVYDLVRPVVIYDDFKTSYVYGDTVHFGKMSCYDFVDNNAKVGFYASVNFEYVTDKNQVVLNGVDNPSNEEYDYVWNNYEGLYAKIFASDYSENESYVEPVFVMLDIVAPTIILGKGQIECTVGQNVRVASYQIEDDKEGVTCDVTIICPSGQTYCVKNGVFKANEKGTYTIMYMVKDLAGNFEFASYNVICK